MGLAGALLIATDYSAWAKDLGYYPPYRFSVCMEVPI
jgi:hypothetical protein